MKVLFVRLTLLSLLSAFVAAPVLMPGPVSASYQSVDGGFNAITPVEAVQGSMGPELSGVSSRGLHGEIPVLSGTDLKGEPSVLDQDWIASTVRDNDARDYVISAPDPSYAPGSADSQFSGWIAAAVAFVAFQILYATFKLGNWLAYAERDRPLGAPRLSQNSKAVRRRRRRLKRSRASGMLAPRRSPASGKRQHM